MWQGTIPETTDSELWNLATGVLEPFRDAVLAARARIGLWGTEDLPAVANGRGVASSPAITERRPSDHEIERRVMACLRSDPALRRSTIRVRSVYDGIVTLTGEAADAVAYAQAFEAAMLVRGVRRVASEIAIAAPESSTAEAA